jgi:hypothetical protein
MNPLSKVNGEGVCLLSQLGYKTLNYSKHLFCVRLNDAPVCRDDDGNNACDNFDGDKPDGNLHARDDSGCGNAWAAWAVNADDEPTGADPLKLNLDEAYQMRSPS